MPDFSYKDILRTLMPKGPVWAVKPFGDMDKLLDAIGEVKETIREYLKSTAYLRNPALTPALPDLEREYGVVPVSTLTEAERRELLAGYVYAKVGNGKDDLQDRLHAAGFTDLRVYQNDPVVDPDVYVGGEWSLVCGHENAVCGHEDSYLGQQGVGGYLLVNGPVYESDGTLHEYSVPDTSETWPMIFFIGGEKVGETEGFVTIQDGDMEYGVDPASLLVDLDGDMEETGTSDWTPSDVGTVTLSKETDARPGSDGTKSLKILSEINDAMWVTPATTVTLLADIEYRIQGWAKSDASHLPDPFVKVGSVEVWTQSGSSSWANFNVTHTPTVNGELSFGADPSSPTPEVSRHVFFDDILVWKTSLEEPDELLYWTAGGGATLAKIDSSPTPYEGVQALEVTAANDFSKQSIEIDVVSQEIDNAYRMHDAGANNIYDLTPNNDTIDNGESLTNPASLTAASNATDATALEFDGDSDGVGGSVQSFNSTGAISAWVKVNDATRDRTFWLKPDASGYKNLPANITCDSTEVAPAIRLEAEDADLTEWADVLNSTSLPVAGTGADMEFDEICPGLEDSHVKFNAGKYYKATSSSLGDVGTDDIVIEFIYQHKTAITYLVNKMAGSTANAIFVYTNGTNLRVSFDTASIGAVDLIVGSGLDDGAWYHAIVFMDRSGNMQGYVNGVASATGDISGAVGDNPGSTGFWTVSASGATGTSVASDFSYIALWHSPGWLSTSAQAAVAAERFALACGIKADVGYSDVYKVPFSQDRASVGYLEKWNIAEDECYLVPVGDDWIRTDKIKTQDASFVSGVRLENSRVNRFLQSENFNTTWTQTQLTSITTGALTALGGQSFDGLICNLNNTAHYVRQIVTTAASETHSVTVYAKAGAVNSVLIHLNEDSSGQFAYYNLSTGALGDVGTGFSIDEPAHIEDKGNGIYRLEFRFTTAGPAATIDIHPSDGSTSGDETFAGDGSSIYTYLFGAQFERDAGGSYMGGTGTSYIKTTTAAVTRIKDTLKYWGYGNVVARDADNAEYKVKFVAPKIGSSYSGYRYFFTVTNGTSSERAETYLQNDDLKLLMYTGGAGQAALTGSSIYPNGNEQEIGLTLAKDNVNLTKDRVSVASDSLATINDKTLIILSGSYANTYQLDGIISDFQVSKYGVIYPRGIIFANNNAGVGPFIAYDDLVGDGSSYEIRASTRQTGTTMLNGGTLTPGTWYHVAMTWDFSGDESKLYVDGVEVDSGIVGSVSGVDTIHAGWAAYTNYDETDTATDYTVTYGDVSIADLRLWGAALPTAYLTELVSRGVPAYEEGLAHEIAYWPKDVESGGYHTVTFEDKVSGLSYQYEYDLTATYDLPPKGSIEAGRGLLSKSSMDLLQLDFGTSTAMASQDFSYSCCLRIEGSGDQLVFGNGPENGTDFHALYYDSASESFVYARVIGSTLREVSAPVSIGRMYHVVVVSDYDGSTNTTLSIAIDGAFVEQQTYTGAPVVTNDDLLMFETGGSPAMQLSGIIAGSKFYTVALSLSDIEAQSTAYEAIIAAGAYATQTITPETLPCDYSGAVYNDGYQSPFIMFQAAEGGPWRAVNINYDEDDTTWAISEESTPINAIRLVAKGFERENDYTVYFDDISGGEDPGSSSIQLVEIAENKQKALEEIVLARKPLHSWAVMVVRYV